jgi:cysteinyl-tRNA synthetase
VTLKLHNTLTGAKDLFEPQDSGHVRMYTCGPTVWNFAHVGNLRAFLFYDLLRRHLAVAGFRVTHVMNLTDIDDRILDQATHAGVTIRDYTRPYEQAFFEDMKALRALPAEHYPKATEHIGDMVEMISTLLARDNAYVAEGDVYFRIASFPRYGALSHLDRGGLRAGARAAKGGRGEKGSARPAYGGEAPHIRQGGRGEKGSARPAHGGEAPHIRADRYDKESVSDFALWKKAQPGDETIGAAWDAPFGRGRPGWHIECSAMSKRYLGVTLDVHAGGVDLMFPHHENEIAQSEAANQKQFVRFWLHSEHLADATGEKMSKSAGGFTTLRDLVAAGHDPLAVRLFLIANAHYRSRIRLSDDALHAAAEQVRRLRDFAERLQRPVARADDAALVQRAAQVRVAYREALDDDLNLPLGMGLVFDVIREANAALDEGNVGDSARRELLGLLSDVDAHLDVISAEEPGLAAEVERLIAEREGARKSRDFASADRIREDLRERGIALEDSKDGVRWRRVRDRSSSTEEGRS